MEHCELGSSNAPPFSDRGLFLFWPRNNARRSYSEQTLAMTGIQTQLRKVSGPVLYDWVVLLSLIKVIYNQSYFSTYVLTRYHQLMIQVTEARVFRPMTYVNGQGDLRASETCNGLVTTYRFHTGVWNEGSLFGYQSRQHPHRFRIPTLNRGSSPIE